MIYINKKSYPYLEEVNEGILREFGRLLPLTGRVLDVGCGRAALGEAIQQLGWEVWGIEQSKDACAAAQGRIQRLIEADLLDINRVETALGQERFDALVFSDVLEHVYNPLGVLEEYLRFVKPGGRVVISLPNAVVWTNRARILCGRVDYADTGVMDRTHIRFFTFRTARELVRAAGCQIERVSSTPYLVRALLPLLKKGLSRRDEESSDPRALINSRSYKLYTKYLYPVEQAIASCWSTMLAFRIVLTASKPKERTERCPWS